MERAYAQALWRQVEKGAEPRRAVAALRDALEARGRLELLPRVARAFVRLADRERRKSALTLTVAREKDAHRAQKDAKEFLDALGASAKDVDIEIDEKLVGGWRLEGREHLVDASHKTQLLDIYQRAVRAV